MYLEIEWRNAASLESWQRQCKHDVLNLFLPVWFPWAAVKTVIGSHGSAVFYLSSPWRGLHWTKTWGAACAPLQEVFVSSFRVSREYILHMCTVRVLISSRPVYLTGHRLITGRTSGFSSFCGWFAFGNAYPAVKILFVHLLSNIIPSFETNYGENLWGFQCFIWFWKCRIRI